VILDCRQYLYGMGDKLDWRQIAYGPAGIPQSHDWALHLLPTGPIRGPFDPHSPVESAVLFRERVHFIGFINERSYLPGELRSRDAAYSGLAQNTNSIICDGSREPETANGCPVLHRMRGPSAVRHSCATLNPDQRKARSPERAQRCYVFFLTLTYMDVGKPPTESGRHAGSHKKR